MKTNQTQATQDKIAAVREEMSDLRDLLVGGVNKPMRDSIVLSLKMGEREIAALEAAN